MIEQAPNLFKEFGFAGTTRIIEHVKRFCEIMKKRVKNNKVKRLVVEEVIKTEEVFIDGLGTLLNWKSKCLAEELITEEES